MKDLRRGVTRPFADAVVTSSLGSSRASLLLHYDSNRPETVTLHHGILVAPFPRWVLRDGQDGMVLEEGKTRSFQAYPINRNHMLLSITGGHAIKVTLPRRGVAEFLAECVAHDGLNAEVDIQFADWEYVKQQAIEEDAVIPEQAGPHLAHEGRPS